MRERLQGGSAVLLVVAAATFHVAPLVTGAVTGEPRHLGGAVANRHWPDLAFLCESLVHFEIATWNPYEAAGYPFHGEAASGAYDPVRWGLCAATGFRSPSYLLAEARCILGLVLAGLFGLLWLRGQGFGWGPAVLGAMTIQAAPALRHDLDWMDVAAVAALPFMLFAADRVVERHRLRDTALLGLATALCGTSGSIWALLACAALVVPYCLVRLVEHVRLEGREEIGPASAALGLSAFLSACLLAPAVLPELLSRVVGIGFDHPLAALVGIHVVEGGADTVPRAIQDLGFPGLLPLVLAPLALVGRRDWTDQDAPPRLGGRWLFALVALAAAALSLTGVLQPLRPFADLLTSGLPLPPHAAEAWIGPAAGGLAAGALSFLTDPGPSAWLARRRLVPLVGSLVLVAVAFASLFLGIGPSVAYACGALALVGLASTVQRLGAGHLLVAALCAVLVLVDAFRGAPSDRGTESGLVPAWVEGEAVAMARARDIDDAHRYADLRADGAGSGSRYLQRDLMVHESRGGSDLGRRLGEALPDAPRLLEQLNVHYVLASSGREAAELPSAALAAVREDVEGLEERQGVLVLPSPMPRAYFVPLDRVLRADDRDEALRHAGELSPGPTAVLDGAVVGPNLGHAPDLAVARAEDAGEPGTGELQPVEVVLLRERLLARAQTSEPGLLVVNEAWAPGWRAWVDETEVPIYRVNGVVRGVFVGDGDVEVRMVYGPLLVVVFRWAALAALLFCLVTFVAPLLQRRKRAA